MEGLAALILSSVFIMPQDLQPGPNGEPIMVAQNYGLGAPHVGGLNWGPAAPGGTPPTDWSSAAAAIWLCEDATAAERLNEDTTTCGTGANTSCDLDNNSSSSGVTKDTTNYIEGTASCSFAHGDDEYLDCTDAECGGASELDISGSISFGGWMRPTVDDATRNAILKFDADGGYRMQRINTQDEMRCGIREGAGDLETASAADNSAPANTWTHQICTFDNGANSIQMYVNGAASGSAATQGDMAVSAADFTLSGALSTADWDGQLDEQLVYPLTLSATEVCRICSCLNSGILCMCDASTPTAYKTCSSDADCQVGGNTTALCNDYGGTNRCVGQNSTETPNCGGCTLTDCNAAVPS